MAADVGAEGPDRRRLSAPAAALAAFVIVSLLLSAVYCAFPWGMAKAAQAGTKSAPADTKPGPAPALRAKAPGAGPAEADSATVRRDVDAGNADFLKGWMTGDADLFAACFAEDGAMLRPGGRVILGRDAIRERMKGAFAKYRMTAGTITTQDLHIIGDRAYETGKWVFTIGEVGKESEAKPDSGHFVEIWKREGPAWRMWRDIGVPQN
jgi:uncharacterized protein (TIGR02246 family)